MKIPYTDKEVEELNDLYMNHGREFERCELIKFLKEKFNYSDVHNIICELRKYSNSRSKEMWDKFHKDYENSTLYKTLIKRIDERS